MSKNLRFTHILNSKIDKFSGILNGSPSEPFKIYYIAAFSSSEPSDDGSSGATGATGVSGAAGAAGWSEVCPASAITIG